MSEIPQEAIDAAARVLSADPGDMDARVWARAVLEASRRFIEAAERERIFDLLGHDHFVIFTEDGWTVEHSVECRLSGQMHLCEHHKAVVRIADEFDPDMAGRWLITAIDSEGEPALIRSDLLAGGTDGEG